MRKIILASTSPRRKKLLKKLGFKFKTVRADYEEDMALKMAPEKLAEFLSENKVKSVANKYKNSIVQLSDPIFPTAYLLYFGNQFPQKFFENYLYP